jgi:heme A synthase
VGYKFATHEEQIWEISHRFHIDAIFATILCGVIVFFVYKNIQKRKHAASAGQAAEAEREKA